MVPLMIGKAISSQDLAPHTPQRRLPRLLFLCLIVSSNRCATALRLLFVRVTEGFHTIRKTDSNQPCSAIKAPLMPEIARGPHLLSGNHLWDLSSRGQHSAMVPFLLEVPGGQH